MRHGRLHFKVAQPSVIDATPRGARTGRSALGANSPIAAVLVMGLGLAAACGHSKKTLDALERSKSDPVTIDTTTNGSPTGTTPPPGDQFSCTQAASQQFDPASMKAYSVPPEVAAEVQSTLALMGPAEKASQMLGVDGSQRNYRDIERSPDVQVPGVGTIRGYKYRDAGRGVNLDAGQDNRPDDKKNFATAYPTASLRGASWDLDLERRLGAAMGDETAASKNNMLLAPCMNIIRHPYWGRTQETYGEDMYHIGRFAAAYTVGLQEYVVGCAKHFAANNIEKSRSKQNAIMSEQTLREIYGRHFEMVVQDGAIGCVMVSYNLVNGVKATQSKHLLRDVLKAPVAQGGFGFDGIALTDWWAMPGDQNVPDGTTAQAVTNEAVLAGTDVEVPWTLHYSQATLANADQTLVADAARRVLTQKYLFNTATGTAWSKKAPVSTLTDGSITTNVAHEDLAEEAAIKSAVLVTNGLGGQPVLPLGAGAVNIAVVGLEQEFKQISSSVPKSCGYDPDTGQGQTNTKECLFKHATDPALGDRGSSRVNGDPARTIGPFLGIQQVAGASRTVTSGNSADAAASADTVVVVVGYTPGDEGEEYYIEAGGDRSSLNLPAGQNELVSSVLDLGKPTIIVIHSGSIVNLPWLAHSNKNQATVWAGYPGVRGGPALGKLIFGAANFSGKMPMAWPTEDLLQVFKQTETTTEMGYFFGYRDYDKRQYVDGTPVNLVFPFGHGLSYTSFEYGSLEVPCETATKEAIVNFKVEVENTGAVDGDEAVLLFVKPPPKPAGITGERPWKELKSFARVSVPAGGKATAELPLRIRDLRRWEGDATGRWVIDSGEYTILVGKNAAHAETSTTMGTLMVNGD
jgi:beta-glucosidase